MIDCFALHSLPTVLIGKKKYGINILAKLIQSRNRPRKLSAAYRTQMIVALHNNPIEVFLANILRNRVAQKSNQSSEMRGGPLLVKKVSGNSRPERLSAKLSIRVGVTTVSSVVTRYIFQVTAWRPSKRSSLPCSRAQAHISLAIDETKYVVVFSIVVDWLRRL